MLQDREQGSIEVNTDVLFVVLALGCFLFVQTFSHVSLKVDFNCVHAVDSLFVPRSLLAEQGPQLSGEGVFLDPVLNEVRDHKLFIQYQHWEVKLKSVIESDVLVNHLGKLMNALSQFDASVPNCAINSHHFILFRLFDDLDLLHCLDLFSEMLIALSS